MSRAQLTILTNICLIEDLEKQRVVMQYRSPETNHWSGYAFPGGHVEEGEVSWIQKDQIPNLDLAYDMLPLMEMMEAPDKSEFFYRHRTEDGWEKKTF